MYCDKIPEIVKTFFESVSEEMRPPGAMDLELDSIYLPDFNASQIQHCYPLSGFSFVFVVCSRQRFVAEPGGSEISFNFRKYQILFCGVVYLGNVSVVLVTGDDAVCPR